MRSTSQRSGSRGLTNVALIRDYQSREGEAPPAKTTPAEMPPSKTTEACALLERWQAPVLPEEEIEAWATRYRLCPKSGMSFVEYLIVRGVGSLG